MTKILVIEDEPMVRNNIEQILELSDYEPIVAKDGKEGLELAKLHLPELIISDIMMPNLDGFGVLKALKKEVNTENIPFIFLTAKAEKSDFRTSMDLGADDYLSKPFTPEELLGAIATRLEKKVVVERKTKVQMQELRNNITLHLPHELNTPLNGIISGAAFLEEFADSLDPDEIREIAENLKISGERLYRMTKNFLLYAHLETIAKDKEKLKSFRAESDKCFVKDLIRATAYNKLKKANREEDLHLDLEDALLAISQKHICKLIDELTDNAVKFSTPGTPVTIVSIVKNRTFNLYVIDRGRGMNSEQFARVGALMQFERKLYEQQGSGLGLAICQTMVKVYGGELRVERKEEKTIVSISLPSCLTEF
ncbi:MAG: hybrid sensor histidine kinase/response regulator [Okeania sp. SIO2H7]|nr:hybrid sensor histidine kinase/response regulator [Okeania sp. SIO2H7]